MHRVLSAFARAAAGDPRALEEAREAWAELATEQQTLLASLGKLLAAAHERSAALPEVLDALAARDLDRARREFRGLATEERELIGAIGRYLADRGERTLPLLGAFDGVGDGGPMPAASRAGDAGPGWAGEPMRTGRVGIRTDLTPEDLLAKLGLERVPPGAARGRAGGARRSGQPRGDADRRRQEPLLPAARRSPSDDADRRRHRR